MRRRRSLRRDVQAIAAVVSLAAAGALTGVTGVAPASADTCTAPVVRGAYPDQGLPSYASLIPGKTTLLHLKVTLPNSADCANKAMYVSGVSASVSLPTGTATTSNLSTPAAGARLPIAGYSTTNSANSGDPVFVFDGSQIVNGSTGSVTATFTANLSYVVHDATTNADTPGSLSVTSVNGSAISKSVGRRTKPIRLLLVPMGDANNTTVPQWDATANQAAIDGMKALDRLAPVADGVSELGGTGNGLQFHISSALINLGKHNEYVTLAGSSTPIPQSKNYLDANGIFCGSGSELSWVSSQLNSQLQSWNTANPNATADRALGVVSQAISTGPTTTPSSTCTEGYANVGGNFAWVRAVAPSTATAPARQGTTGGVAALEVMHTYGGSIVNCPGGTSSSTCNVHSVNNYADNLTGDASNAYNITTRDLLVSTATTPRARALMHFDLSPWDDYSTLYEKADYDFATCVLQTPPNTAFQCGGTTGATTNGGSAAGGSIVMAGTTDGSAAGTRAFTYFESNQLQDGTDPNSRYKLLYFDANNVPVGAPVGVRTSTSYSDHDGGTPNTTTSGVVSFGVAVNAKQTNPPQVLSGLATRFEFRKYSADGLSSTLLYARSLTAPPSITRSSDRAVFSGAFNYSKDGTSSAPAVSPDGRFVARATSAGTVRFDSLADGTQTPLATVAGQDVAWSHDGTKVAVVNGGTATTYPVTYAGGVLTLGTGTTAYQVLLDPATAPASDPAFSVDDRSLLLAEGGDLVSVDLTSLLLPVSSVSCAVSNVLTLPPCTNLTNTSGAVESHPSAGPDGTTIAYERDGAVWTLSASSPATSQASRIPAAGQPAYTAHELLVRGAGGVVSYLADSLSGPLAVSTAAGDTAPAGSASGSVVAFQRGGDVYIASGSSRRVDVTVSGSSAEDYRLSVFRVKTFGEPVLVDLHPTTTPCSTCTFTGVYPADRVADGSSTRYVVTNGFETVTTEDQGGGGQGTIGVLNAAPLGFAARTGLVSIYTPYQSGFYTSYKSIPIAGQAVDALGSPQSAIDWSIVGGAGSSYPASTALGTGASLPDLIPAGGWKAGTYTMTASYQDTYLGSQSHSVTFTIVQDSDGDGIPDSVDNRSLNPCYPVDAAHDWTNGGGADYDHDGIPNALDPHPCSADSEQNMTVSQTSVTVSGGSTGNYIKTRLSGLSSLATGATTSNTFISAVGGFPTSIQAVGIQNTGSGDVVASFNLADFQQAARAFGFCGSSGYTQVSVTVGPPVNGYGFDPTSPIVSC